MAATDFPKLVEDYINDLHSRHPTLASLSGIHAWDERLEDFSPEAIANEIAAIKKFQARLEEIAPLALSFSDIFDYQIIASNMKARLLDLEQIKPHTRNPLTYSLTISVSLLRIAMFEYAPDGSRMRYVIAKEKQIPRMLDAARANIRSFPAIYLKMGIESFKGALGLVQNDLPKAFANVKDAKLQAELEDSTRIAADAIAKYIRHLENTDPDPREGFDIGKENLQAKLEYEEGIDVPLDKLLEIGYRELAKTQEEFRRTAALIDPQRATESVWADAQADHPDTYALVEVAQKQVEDLEAFIREKQIVSLPKGPKPIVIPTPDFLRITGASLWAPGPLDSDSIAARYTITGVDPDWSDSQKEQYLSRMNHSRLWMTSIHETYPGHFVQLALLRNNQSIARKTFAFVTTSFLEGWAHYVEQMMIEEGFGNGDPKIKMGQLADAMLRLCRLIVGIRMNVEGLTVDQATIFFKQNAYIGETPARMEAERGAFDPSYIFYSVGKLAILKLREDYKRYRGNEFSLRDFHDRLLSNGLAPLWVHRQLLMPGSKGKLIQ